MNTESIFMSVSHFILFWKLTLDFKCTECTQTNIHTLNICNGFTFSLWQEVVHAVAKADGIRHLISMATSEHVIMQNEALVALAIASAIDIGTAVSDTILSRMFWALIYQACQNHSQSWQGLKWLLPQSKTWECFYDALYSETQQGEVCSFAFQCLPTRKSEQVLIWRGVAAL